MASLTATAMTGSPSSPTVADWAERVRDAHANHTPVRVRGAGGWMHARWPCTGETLDITTHTGVAEYVPGDLTITAYAGTPLRALQEITAQEGQWIALDPVAHPDSTIGAIVATASDGPLSTGYGRVRDQLLGVEFITGTGDICRAGGRVVKNVAGFDLVRLHTGAWGTLGLLTEVSLRVRAAPMHDETWCVYPHHVSTADITKGWQPVIDAIRAVPSLLAAELLNADAAGAVQLEPRPCLLVRMGGNAPQREAQRRMLQQIGSSEPAGTTVWTRLTTPPAADDLLVQLSVEPSQLAFQLELLQRTLRGIGMHEARTTITPARGTVRVAVSAFGASAGTDAHDEAVALVRALAPAAGRDTHATHDATHDATHAMHGMRAWNTTWWQLPATSWALIASPVADPLSQRLRTALDPHRVLNRGILGESRDAGIAGDDTR